MTKTSAANAYSGKSNVDKLVPVDSHKVARASFHQPLQRNKPHGLSISNKAGSLNALSLSSQPQNSVEIARPDGHLTIVVLGASGDLAKKKTFPALFRLFLEDAFPPNVRIIGYARSKIEPQAFHELISQNFPTQNVNAADRAGFLNLCTYVSGAYDDVAAFKPLNDAVEGFEAGYEAANRMFYLALPPTVFVASCRGIKAAVMPTKGWARVIVEKPFGRDTESSAQLSAELKGIFEESQIYRIDHYLGKEMVQNLVALRFSNHLFSSVWSNQHVSNVQITFKEMIGTEGRGGYFDQFGIIRDVIQNHLCQLLALVAMDKPLSISAEHIRDAKVRVLQQVLPPRLEECVIGQYTGNGKEPGYLEDPTVPKGSKCPTFASMVLRIHNDRWEGVPFIIKAGKGMDEKVVSIRIQFKDEIHPYTGVAQRNELVVRAQPKEAMYLKINLKTPGANSAPDSLFTSHLDLSYNERFPVVRLPDAYETLIREVVAGNTTNFVRSDELDAAWRIFTPLLHAIDRGEVKPIPYTMGTRGPPKADAIAASAGYRRTDWGSTPGMDSKPGKKSSL